MRIPFFQPTKKDSRTGCRTDTTEGVALLTGDPKKAILTIMQSLVFAILFAYAFTFIFRMGETGIWWGMVVGEIVGGLFAFPWARVYLSRLNSQSGEELAISKQVAGQ
jgi:hypothetical protein